jgi:hypothetical protein
MFRHRVKLSTLTGFTVRIDGSRADRGSTPDLDARGDAADIERNADDRHII